MFVQASCPRRPALSEERGVLPSSLPRASLGGVPSPSPLFRDRTGHVHPAFSVRCLHVSCKYCAILIPDLSGKGRCWGDICLWGKSGTQVTMALWPPARRALTSVTQLPVSRRECHFLRSRTLCGDILSVSLVGCPACQWSQVNTAGLCRSTSTNLQGFSWSEGSRCQANADSPTRASAPALPIFQLKARETS